MAIWTTKKLKDITTKIGSGATPRGGKGAYHKKGIPLIRSLNIYDLNFTYNDLAFIDESQSKQLDNVSVEKDDVLLNITGASVCRCTSVPDHLVPARVNQHVSIIRADKKNLSGKYLEYTLVSNRYKRELYGLARTGATREALTKVDIENFEIKLPSIEMQTRIASILSAYDELIENNEKRIKALEEMAQLLYTEWFVKFEFPVNSHPREGWQAKPDGVVSPRNTQNYMSLPYNPKLKERAKELRKAGNLSEVLFWQQVKNGQFNGFDFDRQKIIGNYIVDFYCSNPGVVVEIDGSSHEDKQNYDKERDNYLSSLGLTVVHILDSEVKKNLEGVMERLKKQIENYREKPPRHCCGTPPQEGNSPSLKGWQVKPDRVVGYKSSGGRMVDTGTEYGKIPEGWEVKKLKNIGKTITGKTPPTGNADNFDGEVLFIKTPDIHGNIFVIKSEQTLSLAGFKLQSSKLLLEKTVFVSCIGTLGIVGITSRPSQTNQQINALVLNDNSDYIFFYLFAKSLKQLLIGLGSNGATMGNVNKDKFENIQLLYPDKQTRQDFFNKTSEIFDEILTLQHRNEILSQTRDLLIPQLVSGRRVLQ